MLSCNLQLDLLMLKQLKKQPVHSQPSTQSRRKKQKRTAGFFSNQRYRISASFGLRKEVRQQMESDNRIYQGTEKSHGLFFFLNKKQSKEEGLEILRKAFCYQSSDSNWNLLFLRWNLLLPKAEWTKKLKVAHSEAETSTMLNSGKEF